VWAALRPETVDRVSQCLDSDLLIRLTAGANNNDSLGHDGCEVCTRRCGWKSRGCNGSASDGNKVLRSIGLVVLYKSAF
jgi:hypothetical protein